MKDRYVVMSYKNRRWVPLRVFKHKEAAEQFTSLDPFARCMWTIGYRTRKR